LSKKMAPVSGKRCLSSVIAPESGTTSIITQNLKNERRKMKRQTFIFYVKEPPLSKKKICSSQEIYKRMRNLAKADQESFWVIGFNGQNREIYHECLFIGGINICTVDLKILFKRLLNVGACAFIIVHNHPGGSCGPASNEDISITGEIKKISEIITLKLLDHIIISDDGYFSFKDYGLLS